jgi:hypothetical protein
MRGMLKSLLFNSQKVVSCACLERASDMIWNKRNGSLSVIRAVRYLWAFGPISFRYFR